MRKSLFEILEILLLLETVLVLGGLLGMPRRAQAVRPPATVAPAPPIHSHFMSC